MPTHIHLLRHAESANPAVFHGAESDIGLSEKGMRQAAAIAEVLAPWRPDAVISSGMTRAKETARPLVERLGLTLQIEPLLHERKVGALSLQPHDALGGIWPETIRRWIAGDTNFAHAGAESLDDLRARLLPVWNRLVDQHANRKIVVVAHGVVCKVLLVSLIPGWSLADWQTMGPIRNTALTELLHEDGAYRAVRVNEHAGAMIAAGLT